MLKATLQYSDYLSDQKNVFRILADCGVSIIKSKHRKYTVEQRIIIIVKDYAELNALISALNRGCIYGVSVLKVKRKWFS